MKKWLVVSLLSLVAVSSNGFASIEFLGTNQGHSINQAKLTAQVKGLFNEDQYRKIKLQPVFDDLGRPDHLVVYLFKKGYHRVDFAKVAMDTDLNLSSVEQNYRLTAQDHAVQPGTTAKAATCPDPTTQFIAFAPNDDSTEQGVTVAVANEAIKKGLKTVQLLITAATRDAYLNYMSCPNLLGNFYDGDANPQEIVTNDGTIEATDFSTTLKGAWNYNVTNIWLACEAYNNPMLPAVQTDAQARKFAAGINDLEIGPSDNAAACAMEAAIDGQPMQASFNDCLTKLDNSSDHWGYGGNGTDSFYNN